MQADGLVADDILAIFDGFNREIARTIFEACVVADHGCLTMEWNDHRHVVTVPPEGFGYAGLDGNYGYGLWLWHYRFHKPWQKDLERYLRRALQERGSCDRLERQMLLYHAALMKERPTQKVTSGEPLWA